MCSLTQQNELHYVMSVITHIVFLIMKGKQAIHENYNQQINDLTKVLIALSKKLN